MNPDVGNGLFEFIGGILLWMSVRRLWVDRVVKGVWWPAWFFYMGWGMWNLYYYPSLGQWYSFSGGLLVVSANMTWVGMATFLHLRRRSAQ